MKGDLIGLVRLLHAGGREVFQDHLVEGAFHPALAVPTVAFLQSVDQFIVFIYAEAPGEDSGFPL